jgi:pimeloyl-ACP methyl ester carboxylesterase
VLAELLDGGTALPAEILAAIDPEKVVMAGHSYGAYTALATAAGVPGASSHGGRVGAVLCFQPFTRTISDDDLARVRAPALLVVSELDGSTPAATDADRPWALLGGQPVWRLDLAGAAHQASSDIGLYAELVEYLPGIPEPVHQYLELTAVDAIGPGLRPWRDLLAMQVRAAWAFLDVALDLDPVAGGAAAVCLAAEPGLTLRER